MLDEGLSEWAFQMLLPRLPDFRSDQISDERSFPHPLTSLCLGLSEALDFAVSRNHSKVVNLLLDAGIQPSARTLIAAVHRRDQESISRLLDGGANPHATYNIESPEHYQRIRDVWEDGFKDPIELMSMQRVRTTTSYAQAIRIGFKEGTELFDTICPTNILSCSPASLCILSAACQSGMIGLVSSYLDGTFLEDCKSINHDKFPVSFYRGYSVVESIIHDCLLFAINYRHEHIVRRLLGAGVTVNTNHLLLAIRIKDAALTRELLEYCDQHGPYLDNFSHLLDAALTLADALVIQNILELGHVFPTRVISADALCVAIEHQDRTVIQWLLDVGADINGHRLAPKHFGKEYSPLKAAVKTNNFSLVDYVLYLGADPYDSAALTAAITADRTEIVERLLEAFEKRFPRSRGRHVVPGLRIAIDRNDLSLVKALAARTNLDWMEYCSTSFEIGSYSYSLLGAAIIKPTADALVMMQLLLKLRADPNTIAFIGCGRGNSGSPLQLAIHEDSLEKYNLLLKYGANIHLKPHRAIKQTPLQYACKLGRYSMVVNLLEQGADANAPASFDGGGTALQFASIGGFTGILELLLHHHADVNAASSKLNGRTCFEGATEHGRLDTMIFLMKNGADIVSDGGNQYRRAVEFAEQNEQIPAMNLAEELYQIAKNISNNAGAQSWNLDW